MASPSTSTDSNPRSEFTQLVSYVEERWDAKDMFCLIYNSMECFHPPHSFSIEAVPNPIEEKDADWIQAEATASHSEINSRSCVMISFTIPDRKTYPNWEVMANVELLEVLKNGQITHDCNLHNGMADVNLMNSDLVVPLMYEDEANAQARRNNYNSGCYIHFKLKMTITKPRVPEGPVKTLELYGSRALTDFGRLFNDPIASDVTIKVLQDPPKAFHCHRAILSARSPVFLDMFTNDMQAAQKNVVEISDIPSQAMDHFLSFLYCGYFQDSSWTESLPNLVYAFDKYDVESLKDLCDANLILSVNKTNALALGKLASQHKLTNAVADIRKFIKENADDISLDFEDSLPAKANLSYFTSEIEPDLSYVNISFSIPNRNAYRDWKVMVNVELLEILVSQQRVHDSINRQKTMADVNLMEQDCVRSLLSLNDLAKLRNAYSPQNAQKICIHFKLKCTITKPIVKSPEGPPRSLELYGSEALIEFGALLNDPVTGDVTIKVLQEPHTSFHCHRAILSARSPVFLAMFSSDMQEAQKNVVEVPDISAETMAHFLSFLYSGHFQDSSWPQSLPKLVYASDKYCVKSLKKLCDSYLILSVTTKNALALAKLASQHELTKALADIRKFIQKHTSVISFDCIEISEDE